MTLEERIRIGEADHIDAIRELNGLPSTAIRPFLESLMCSAVVDDMGVVGGRAKVGSRRIYEIVGRIADVLLPDFDLGRTPTPTPEAQPTPPEATPKSDAALPDYLHMKSYTPTIPFDMSALYTFLKDEGVIRDIDEPLFADCIMHANMNEVWKVGNHHKLKCVFRYVKDHFPNNWIDVVAQRMNTTRKKITAFQRDKIRDFERKLRNIV